MNDFKSAYQSAVQDSSVSGMEERHIDVSDCLDGVRHKRYIVRRARRTATAVFSFMCLIFIGGFGTVKAAEYIQNVIKVNEWGFESGDTVTMASADEVKSRAYLLGEEVCPMPALEGRAKDEAAAEPAAEKATEADALEYTGAAESSEVLKTEETEEIPVYNYNSFEEFEKNETILFPQPSISIGTNITATDITVCGDWAMVRYDVDGKVLWLERTNYADTDGHTSSKVFPGGVENERAYTTTQGHTYTLVDSVKAGKDEPLQIHAAATVGSYEVFIDFLGFEEEEAERIMDSIDLSLYE